jgi:hypothetical protein
MCTKLEGWQIWNLDPSSKSWHAGLVLIHNDSSIPYQECHMKIKNFNMTIHLTKLEHSMFHNWVNLIEIFKIVIYFQNKVLKHELIEINIFVHNI